MSSPIKVLLIGAKGQLGTDLNRVFREAGDTVFPYVHAQLDVCSEAQVGEVLNETRPDLVLNTAAYHRVEECEKRSDLAFQVNGTAPMQLAIACQKAGATLVHFSTDYVFGGYAKNTPYDETDRPAPLNVYGASKVLGEYLIPDYTDRYFVLRVCGLYGTAGSSGKGGNFVETMLKKGMAGESIRVVDDQVLTPTYTVDLAEAVRKLVVTGKYGLYHLSSEGECSWYEFTRHIFESAGIQANLSPVKSSEFNSPVKRPSYSVLGKAKARALGVPLPSWKDALPRYLKQRAEKLSAVTVQVTV
jgi:dTDP-4-dehydrorhamnose reductase